MASALAGSGLEALADLRSLLSELDRAFEAGENEVVKELLERVRTMLRASRPPPRARDDEQRESGIRDICHRKIAR
jgi:hypothetical protein